VEVGWEEGEGAVKIVDRFEVQVTFVAYRKGMMTADNSLGFIIYLERKREERVHHGGRRRKIRSHDSAQNQLFSEPIDERRCVSKFSLLKSGWMADYAACSATLIRPPPF